MSLWKFSADTGGTFTDCLLEAPEGSVSRGKVLSSGRLRTSVKRRLGIDRIEVFPFPFSSLDWLLGQSVWLGGKHVGQLLAAEGHILSLERIPEELSAETVLEIDSGVEAPVLGMRMLFMEHGPQVPEEVSFRLGTTKGTNALLERKGAPTALFLSRGFEDLLLIRDQKRPDLFSCSIERPAPLYQQVYGVRGRLDSRGNELEPLDEEGLYRAGIEAMEAGCSVAAVGLLHSWTNPHQEHRAGEILRSCGLRTVCLSSQICPMIKYLDRVETTLVNATLSPVMDAYLDRVQSELAEDSLWIMTSAGGLVSRARFNAVDSLVSGPAGGVLGAVSAGQKAGCERIIALDMGGTSTDVSRWKTHLELRQRIQVGEARILTQAMPIETVAAGGGSVCGFDGDWFFVGPESAGADPGPSSYGAGGPLTLTDIHLLLGRIDPGGFSIPIRIEAAREALESVACSAGESDWKGLAEGFLTIATERMAQAIRQVSLREGEDPAEYTLVAFGGAGGLHACRVAEELNISQVLFPPDAGILSARGIHYAQRESVIDKQLLIPLETARDLIPETFSALQDEALQLLIRDGVAKDKVAAPARTVFLRLAGQENSLPVSWEPGTELTECFRHKFVAIFGYYPKDPRLEVVELRLRLSEIAGNPERETFAISQEAGTATAMLDGVYNGRAARIPCYSRKSLSTGTCVKGPAIIQDPFATCFIEARWIGVCGSGMSIQVSPVENHEATASGEKILETVEKTLVYNRLENLVEEMGDQLKRTALSTNIRERLDFSCALLDARGRLLLNAPHIPVHLGAMGLCVRECLKDFSPGPGDVIITNHPGYGGSHLPDVTVFCGLFDEAHRHLGFLANRAHHAEWGGKSPGSMPADATALEEEGVILHPQWLIRDGKDRFDELESILKTSIHPSRAVRENRIDLEAQVASLLRGTALFNALLQDYDSPTLTGYLKDIYQSGAEAFAGVIQSRRLVAGRAEERLDDGHSVCVAVRPGPDSLLIDFTGTSAVHPGNLNATPAIVRSAVLYVLRLLVDTPLPLSEGILDSVRIELPRCFLNPEFPDDPSACPAVVGGNVETSQRIVDALIRALKLMAAGQGTMNNLLFGNSDFGYYETIGGGSGAGQGFDGASGVHVHMTNTAITDPEVIEHRFPVICREFSLRKNSGGPGRYKGGDGLVREIQFEEAVSVSLLGQNRTQGAKGLNGGGAGQRGRQFIVHLDGSRESVGGQVQIDLKAGEAIRIETPGGGGWGRISD